MKATALLFGALVSVTTAHSNGLPSMPKLLGARGFLSEMKARGILPEAANYKEDRHVHLEAQALQGRENAAGTCGAGIGSCAAGRCCSGAGFCGTGLEYCAAPDCQFQYGPACDANHVPGGTSTSSVARPKLGSVLYGGVGVYDCVVPGDVAFTFDDGPYLYTDDLLTKMAVYDAKGTFFITGNNLGKGPIDTTARWSSVIKRMVAEGHQIASHTWSHQNLSSLSTANLNNQMVYNEMAFRNILGYFPTYMRPPYSECGSACQSRLTTLGYHITYFDLDTAGYLNTESSQIQKSKDIWDAAISTVDPKQDNFLEIEHDIHYQVVYNLTDYILASMYKHGFKSVTVGDCLGDPKANWYRTAGGAGTNLPTSASSAVSSTSSKTSVVSAATSTYTGVQTISDDGSCSEIVTCQGSFFGNCCSPAGFCGSTEPYCGTGCNPASGSCGAAGTAVSSAPASTSTPVVSTEGFCATQGETCLGSSFGNCCSFYGFCGTTDAHCGTGCQLGFGLCGIGAGTSSVAAAASSSTSPASSSTSISSSTGSVTAQTATTSSSSSSAGSSPSTSSSPTSSSSSSSPASSSTSSSPSSSSSSTSSSRSTTSSSTFSVTPPVIKATTTTSSTSSRTSSTTSTPAAATPTTIKKTTTGACGGTTGLTCAGTTFGTCCSKAGKCGGLQFLSFDQPYCGTGCQSKYSLFCTRR